MYERSYGYRYEETEAASLTEIAKQMRADIRTATTEGLLPGKPVTYSVRSDGHSIDILVKGWGDYLEVEDLTRCSCLHSEFPGSNHAPLCPARRGLTPEAEAAKMTLERIHGAYNHDGSDIQSDYFDVRYYGQVGFESASAAAWRDEQKAKKTARREALDSAPAVRLLNFTRNGRVVHDAVEKNGKLFLACSGRYIDLPWPGAEEELTCSRCIKRATRLNA